MPKPRKKRSEVWKPTSEEFLHIFNECSSIGEMLARFNLRNVGSNYRTLTTRLKAENITWEKFRQNIGKGLEKRIKYPLEVILVENSSYNNTSSLKKRLIKERIFTNECSICKQQPIWNSQKLTMVLDHINGVRNDNRIENLRLLCPNCNSQTDTFAGKNKKYDQGTNRRNN